MRQRVTMMMAGVLVSLMSGATAAAAGKTDWRWLIVCDGPDAEAERRALVEALRLLPRLPARVAVIDATEARPEVQPTLLRLDAFVVKHSTVVYVVRQSRLLAAAVQGSSFHVHALAAVLWHEMAHADGADELEARKREVALWTTFMRDQQIDAVLSQDYLVQLLRRPDHAVVASRCDAAELTGPS
jgi:hypothetical protein